MAQLKDRLDTVLTKTMSAALSRRSNFSILFKVTSASLFSSQQRNRRKRTSLRLGSKRGNFTLGGADLPSANNRGAHSFFLRWPSSYDRFAAFASFLRGEPPKQEK